ncbi:MAG: hypothetical protein K8T20_11460 [Planctomycetes bacterium]|nr:hypothetical protein [Planctomycetota bacterium]
MKKLALAVAVLIGLAGCETLGIGGGGLKEDVKVTSDPGLFAQTKAEGKVLKVLVKDADGVAQQDSRVVVDLGNGGGQVLKMTDASGEALFADLDLKKVLSIKVEKTERTRKAGS